jgi:hypothetical protein
MSYRYDYAWFRTYERAHGAIAEYCAMGEMLECELPQVEERDGRFVVTLLVTL